MPCGSVLVHFCVQCKNFVASASKIYGNSMEILSKFNRKSIEILLKFYVSSIEIVSKSEKMGEWKYCMWSNLDEDGMIEFSMLYRRFQDM